MKSLRTRSFDEIETKNFHGAFAYDEIPDLPEGEWSIIVNTASSSNPGEHWIALVFKDGVTYFMDSYGRELNLRETTFSPDFVNKMKSTVRGYVVNNRQLLQQLTSNACGYYAVYFVERLTVESMKKTLQPFSENLKQNDMYVYNYCLS
jgi:hypothetical protein